MSNIRWACPRCGAESGKHGKGGREKCEERNHGDTCSGLICECEGEMPEGHGDSLKNPCEQANCYHCGWSGKFPTKATLKKLNMIPCPHCHGSGAIPNTNEKSQ